MELKKLDKSVLKMWYIQAVIISLIVILAAAGTIVNVAISNAPGNILTAVSLGCGVPCIILLCFILIMPALRYKMYAWGCDDTRIIVKQGVIFRERVVIPVCQIQDLHRKQGPLMMMFKLSDVTISTAGSNFDISTLTTAEADRLIEELEQKLEARIEAQKNEKI